MRRQEELPPVQAEDGTLVYVTLQHCRCGAFRTLVAVRFKSSRRHATSWAWEKCRGAMHCK
jgi:hypothetical protein